MARDLIELTQDLSGIKLATAVATTNLNDYKAAELKMISTYESKKTAISTEVDSNKKNIALAVQIKKDIAANQILIDDEIKKVKAKVKLKQDILATKESELVILLESKKIDEVAVKQKESEILIALDVLTKTIDTENKTFYDFSKTKQEAILLKSKGVIFDTDSLTRKNTSLISEIKNIDDCILIRQGVIKDIDAALLTV